MAKTKKQVLEERIIKAVGAGKEIDVETVDFSDPNRPKTILEVDFPILPVNQVAAIEGNAGKPIYQMSKWWARRRSSVFRTMLLAGAMKAPEDPIDAAKKVWEVYYANHQKKGALNHLKVADVFMGGGTTLVEGTRLGMQMYGNDLNPVAWLVVKNELAKVDLKEVQAFADEIEKKVKPQIMPYYASECPRGHKGKWLKFHDENVPISPFFDELVIGEPSEKDIKNFNKKVSSFEGWLGWYKTRGYEFEVMGNDFNPLSLNSQERPYYRYWGPEVIYTFWTKYGPCQNSGCNHRTPIMTTPVIAVKELSVKTWSSYECENCNCRFDIEQKEARMSPGAPLFISESEETFVTLDKQGDFKCPSCGNKKGISSLDIRNAKNKKVSLTLLLHPEWLKGKNAYSDDGRLYGGRADDSLDSTLLWNIDRAENIAFVEVRGNLPEQITCPETGVTFLTGEAAGSNKGRGKFICASCGTQQQLSTSLSYTGGEAPVSAYAHHCQCPECANNGELYSGRTFIPATDVSGYNQALTDWEEQKNTSLKGYWPESEILFSHQTHQRDNLPNHGYSHWWKMFNFRQLFVLSYLMREIVEAENTKQEVKEVILGAYQQYLRYQNMFVFWQMHRDCLAPHFSNNNYHPKPNVVENGVFSDIGSGNFKSCLNTLLSGLRWKKNPWEIVSSGYINHLDEDLEKVKNTKVYPKDTVVSDSVLNCSSATELEFLKSEEMDLIITDPPFGDNVQYAELADFFYVWLKNALEKDYPEVYNPSYTPKALEAVANRARHPENPNEFYQRLLTESWRECYRVLKPGGILAFTFHHSEDEPWIAVLESLFKAGFYLEATYPIRSDESKGEKAEFGSKKIEYDIIHVCRKRTEEPKSISWARLRKKMIRDIRQLEEILQNHLASGLTESDIQVIRRGKALEYFSKHYGQVYVEEGREFTVKEALIGINQILDDEKDINIEAPPIEAEVMTRQFLRIFNKTVNVQRNEMQNYLRGTGVAASDFIEKNWCYERNRTFTLVSPLLFAREWKGKQRKGLSYDLDQTLFFIGACFKDSGINVNDTLSNSRFSMHPAVVPLLNWFSHNGGTSELKQAAMMAFQLCASWQAKNPSETNKQLALFGLSGEE